MKSNKEVWWQLKEKVRTRDIILIGEIRAYLCPDRTDTVERRKLKMGEERQR